MYDRIVNREPKAQFRIGISGWTYKSWRGVFYPPGLVHRRELEYASGRMNSVEINGSFYSLQRPSSYEKWAEQTPPDFLFAVKGGRFITHMKKLNDVRVPLANFFASGVLALGEKLGPILWQFPPNWGFDRERVENFLEMLPATTHEAAILATENEIVPSERTLTETAVDVPIRYAFEVRHPSFFTAEFVRLLQSHNAALVFADAAGTWPYAEDITADFVYVRLHGAEQLYASGYTDEQLNWWANRIGIWSRGTEPADAKRIVDEASKVRSYRDVFVYFDNDIDVHAPFDAMRLAKLLKAGSA